VGTISWQFITVLSFGELMANPHKFIFPFACFCMIYIQLIDGYRAGASCLHLWRKKKTNFLTDHIIWIRILSSPRSIVMVSGLISLGMPWYLLLLPVALH